MLIKDAVSDGGHINCIYQYYLYSFRFQIVNIYNIWLRLSSYKSIDINLERILICPVWGCYYIMLSIIRSMTISYHRNWKAWQVIKENIYKFY